MLLKSWRVADCFVDNLVTCAALLQGQAQDHSLHVTHSRGVLTEIQSRLNLPKT